MQYKSSDYLESFKNRAKVKLKVKESIDILPRNYECILTDNDREKKGTEIIDQKLYSTEKAKCEPNLHDISEFIKSEKKILKQNVMKRKILIGNNFTTENPAERDTPCKESIGKKKANTDTNTYKSHSEGMDRQMDDLLKRNSELEGKVQGFSEMEREYHRLTIDALKYKKFKKLAYEFRKEQRECIYADAHSSNEGCKKCDNTFCMANLVALIELQKAYEKLLIDNAGLKKENNRLKKKDIV